MKRIRRRRVGDLGGSRIEEGKDAAVELRPGERSEGFREGMEIGLDPGVEIGGGGRS